MAPIRSSKVTRKGQVTIPVDIRERLGFQPGDVIIFEERDGHITIRHPGHGEDQTSESQPDDEVDPSAGVLANFAYTRNPDPAQERKWVARHIAETTAAEE